MIINLTLIIIGNVINTILVVPLGSALMVPLRARRGSWVVPFTFFLNSVVRISPSSTSYSNRTNP